MWNISILTDYLPCTKKLDSSSLDTLDIGLKITIVIRIILRMSVDNILCIFYTNAIEDTYEL